MTHPEWEALLDRFDAELAGSHVSGEGWEPPADPLPAELAARAQDIVARQRAAMQQLRDQLTQVQQQRSALDRIPREQARPAYLDLAG